MATALSDVDKALYQKAISDKGLTALLGGEKFYDSSPPQGTSVPYISLGNATEDKDDVFNAKGNIGSTRIHIFSTTRRKVLEIYNYLNSIFDSQSLTLDNNILIHGNLVLSVIMRDPDDPNVTHAVAVFSYTSREATS
jgi:hypothetical protein